MRATRELPSGIQRRIDPAPDRHPFHCAIITQQQTRRCDCAILRQPRWQQTHGLSGGWRQYANEPRDPLRAHPQVHHITVVGTPLRSMPCGLYVARTIPSTPTPLGLLPRYSRTSVWKTEAHAGSTSRGPRRGGPHPTDEAERAAANIPSRARGPAPTAE